MAHRGARHAALRADEAGRPRRSAHRPRAVRRRAAAAGQPRRRSLQPRRLSDADQMGRAGARAAADSRARAGRVRPLRHGPPQHLRQRPDGAAPRRGRSARARRCSSPARCRASKATSSRRRRGCSPASTPRRWRTGEPASAPPRTTAIGALAYYVSHADPAHYEPSNITFGIMEPLDTARREARWSGSWRCRSARSTRLARLDAARERCMIEHLEGVPAVSRAEPQRCRAHTVRAYESDLVAVPRARRRRAPASSARDLDAGGARSRRRSAAFSRELHAQGQSRATAARKLAARPHVPPLPAARRAHRRRSRRAGRHAEARRPDAGAPVRGRDDRAARGAGRRPAARPPRPRDPRAVLRVGPAAERARRPRSRRREPERDGWCGCSARAARSGSCRSTAATATAIRAYLKDRERLVRSGGRTGGPARAARSQRRRPRRRRAAVRELPRRRG